MRDRGREKNKKKKMKMKKEAVVIAAILIATDLPLSADVSILPPRTPLRYGEGGLTDAGGGADRARARSSAWT